MVSIFAFSTYANEPHVALPSDALLAEANSYKVSFVYEKIVFLVFIETQ